MFKDQQHILPVNLEDFIKKVESEENLENLVSSLIKEYFTRLDKS
ncbi:hypothetical protein [Ammoniphilus oxalaticus]|nr:hypothetical protein [Ammoniphilus oxalaticus]